MAGAEGLDAVSAFIIVHHIAGPLDAKRQQRCGDCGQLLVDLSWVTTAVIDRGEVDVSAVRGLSAGPVTMTPTGLFCGRLPQALECSAVTDLLAPDPMEAPPLP